MNLCNYCREPAELLCVRCRDRYCSKACQDADWPQHKLFCFPMPSLMRSPIETTFIKSEPVDVLRAPSPSSKCRNIKLATDNDIITKSCPVSLGSAENVRKTDDSVKSHDMSASSVPSANISPKIGQPKEDNIPKTNGSVKTNGNVPSANISSKIDQPKEENIPKSNGSVKTNGNSPSNIQTETKSSIKPAYYKTDNVDAASLRKPGTLSQVMPSKVQPSSTQPTQQTIQDKGEPPKQQKIETIETTPKMQQKVEPPKMQQKVEPPKMQQKVEPPKIQQKVEPPKIQQKVEPPKVQQKVEPPKIQQKVEPPKMQQKVEPPKQAQVDPMKKCNSDVQSPKSGPWMKPFPMEDNVFVDVTVQYTAPDDITWVSLTNKENENGLLLKKVNKIVSVATTPSPNDVQINSLFLVPFEDIYYRGVVLKPVSSDGTVSVRLVDYGNQLILPIDQLKTALPSVCEANAYAFPIKFKKPCVAEVGKSIKVKKVSTERDVITVVVDDKVDATSNMITLSDIDVAPLPEGENQDVTCLDFSNVKSGYVSLCILNAKALQYIDDMGKQITKHCEETKDEYRPQVNELCLAKFEEDGWFRAVTLKANEPNKFEIMFIDFGNKITVTSSHIRKMIDDFTYPSLMNICYIKGFPKAPTKDDVMKAAIYFDANQTFRADLIEKIGDKYYVTVKF